MLQVLRFDFLKLRISEILKIHTYITHIVNIQQFLLYPCMFVCSDMSTCNLNALYCINRLGTSAEGAELRARMQSACLLSDMESFKVSLTPGAMFINPFQTNGIFHKATYNIVRMTHCIYNEGSQVVFFKNCCIVLDQLCLSKQCRPW